MNHKKIDALSETMRIIYEQTENNMVTEINVALAKQTPIRTLARRLDVIKLNSDRMVDSMLKNISDTEGISLARITEDNRALTTQLANNTLNAFNRSSNRIQLRGGTPLVEAVKKEAQRNFNERVKVTYRDGRNVGYKEYMEMATRTTIQQEIGSAQLVTGGNAGVVFYITNHFKDCADDHKDYQGKIYYDERWQSFGYDDVMASRIQGIINKKRMLSVQAVRDGKPYLTTRPNCRHNFIPISVEQAGGNASDLVRDLNISTGSYRDKNYEDTVKQRYNERQIRFYKARMEQYDKMGADYSDMMQRDKVLVAKWQARQRALIDKNSTLSRDYRRESLSISKLNIVASNKVTGQITIKNKNPTIIFSKDDTPNIMSKKIFDVLSTKTKIKKVVVVDNKRGIDNDVVEKIAKNIENLSDEYENDIVELQIGNSPQGTLGQVIRVGKDQHSIYMVKDIKREAIRYQYKKQTQDSDKLYNLNPIVDDDKIDIYVSTHEFGHTLYNSNQVINYPKNHKMRIFDSELKKIKKQWSTEMNNLSKIRSQDVPIEEKNMALKKQVEINISNYAKTNIDEFLAESFAQAKLSSKPSPYALKVLELVNKHFRK